MRFRNDDVNYGSNVDYLKQFCAIFDSYNYKLIQSITVRGNIFKIFSGKVIPNQVIINNSVEIFSQNEKLVQFLASRNDDLALHGLYHIDYSQVDERQTRSDMELGIKELKLNFPGRDIKYFVCPFNKYADHTSRIAQEFGMEMLAWGGKVLEPYLKTARLGNEWLTSDIQFHSWRFFRKDAFFNLESPCYGLEDLNKFLVRLKKLEVGG